MREEGFSESEANQKWLEDLANPQVRREKKNGVMKLAVSGHDAFVSEQGTSKEQRMSKQTALETTEEKRSAAKRARRTHDMSDAHFADFGGDHFRDGASAVAGASMTDGDAILGGFDDDDDIFPCDSVSSVAAGVGRAPCAREPQRASPIASCGSSCVAASSASGGARDLPPHQLRPMGAASSAGGSCSGECLGAQVGLAACHHCMGVGHRLWISLTQTAAPLSHSGKVCSPTVMLE